jgi:hypothetical protein
MLPLVDLHSQLDEALNVNNSDSIFATELYTDLINEQRALFIRNEYNRKRELDPNIQQSFCEDLELVDPHNCPCTEIPIGCKILRTKRPIPNSIELHHKKTITSVGPIIITERRFTLIDYDRVPYIGNGRTTSKAIYAFLYDNYIYVISKKESVKLLKKIAIRGIWEDPTAVAEFVNCDENNICWKPTDPYPLNQWMWAYVKEQVIQQLLRKRQIPEDDSNNAQDDLADGGQAAPAQSQQQQQRRR